jgi:Family of unknown function (DUF5519)
MEQQISLPTRHGPRPRTTPCAPHSQIDQIPTDMRALCLQVIEAVSGLDHVELGGSRRAPPGTVGLYMSPEHATNTERCFLLGHEFAHVHLEDDGSLHLILPEPLRTAAIEAGWAEPHPMAGLPTVSLDTVMLYAPRDAKEVATIAGLVRSSWANALRSS